MVSDMEGRRDDSARGPGAFPSVPPRPVVAQPVAARPAAARPVATPPERPAPPAPAHDQPSPPGRRGWLVLGLGLAAAATAAVLFTDEPLYLRVALLAVCWAFVGAALLAGNRRADQLAAAAREAELRHAYDQELAREVAARHEYEAELEGRLRREAEDAMRSELTGLRSELTGLRGELAGLATLREDLAAITQLRADLAGLGQLRTDLGRMRTELTEQLSGELLIERLVMRAQSVRGPAQPAPEQADGRTVQAAPAWELESGGPAGAGEVDHWAETRVFPAGPGEPAARPGAGPPPEPAPRRHRRAAGPDEDGTSDWSATQSSESPSYESPSYESPFAASPAYEPTTSGRSSFHGSTSYDVSGYAAAGPVPAEPAQREPSGHARLEQILAESGVAAPSGGRSRHRRYRDEDDETAGDDVLARVLGRK